MSVLGWLVACTVGVPIGLYILARVVFTAWFFTRRQFNSTGEK